MYINMYIHFFQKMEERMVGLLTLFCRLDLRWYCSVSSGALRIPKFRGDGPIDGRNILRERAKGSLSVFTVGWEWTIRRYVFKHKSSAVDTLAQYPFNINHLLNVFTLAKMYHNSPPCAFRNVLRYWYGSFRFFILTSKYTKNMYNDIGSLYCGVGATYLFSVFISRFIFWYTERSGYRLHCTYSMCTVCAMTISGFWIKLLTH